MKIFSRSKDTPPQTKLQKRVSKIPTRDLVAWADQALNSLGRALYSLDRHGETSAIDEAVDAAEALHEVVLEIRRRA